MGDRYGPWDEPCPKCGKQISCYYAESSEFTTTKCLQCNTKFDIIMEFKLEETPVEKTEGFKEINSTVSCILINDGPDGHCDGSEVITSFIMALLRGEETSWYDDYMDNENFEDMPKKWRNV